MTDAQKLKIKYAYHDSKDFYDKALTSGNIWLRLYNKIVWGLDDKDYVEEVLSFIPDDLTGRLLDVPVGTGVHTGNKYAKLQLAHVIALDYSSDMLQKARRRLGQHRHIEFVQGDVGALPYENAAFDMVFSMNGFHAFPDKQKAFDETDRVLKPGGVFCGCFYIRGQRKMTDFAIHSLYVGKGWFTPPFFTLEELGDILKKRYRKVRLMHVKSIAYFHCVK